MKQSDLAAVPSFRCSSESLTSSLTRVSYLMPPSPNGTASRPANRLLSKPNTDTGQLAGTNHLSNPPDSPTFLGKPLPSLSSKKRRRHLHVVLRFCDLQHLVQYRDSVFSVLSTVPKGLRSRRSGFGIRFLSRLVRASTPF